MRLALALAALAVATAVPPVSAQIPLPTPPVPTGDPADTVTVDPFRFPPPISPAGALLRSMLLPGWGQSILRRRGTGAAFVLWEGISLTMTLKSRHQLSYLRSVESEDDIESQERVTSKEQEVEDWAILLAFNHLMAGVESYVAALLWDFPEELDVRAFRDGDRVGLGFAVGLP